MASAGVWSSPQSAAYWSYHVGRTGLLAVQGVAGAHLGDVAACAWSSPAQAASTSAPVLARLPGLSMPAWDKLSP